ncbi:uncharacterized protein [Cicer arietinum]|uniref:Uncharacterized protein LOC101499602 isoform X2 n=1 Tax=Cicer arietinum TaxID=3827 RepID=A0A1S3E928_CICAR|nr:uncharacterized protein LOC101499602 isoform X2 [Cicer arietinum]
MDNQDQRRTHIPGNENHGVHVCNKCGWLYPNPHPSAKNRRAHKKICGTIQGYKLDLSQEQTLFNASDDDHKTPPSLVVSGSNNEKGNDGMNELLGSTKFSRAMTMRSEDDVFSDAAAEFSDTGVKDRLQQQDSLDSGTDVERINKKEQTHSDYSEYKDCSDMSPLIVNSSNDCQIENPEILQNENVEAGNIVGLQGQLSGSSSVDPLTSSVADLNTEELCIVYGDGFSGLSSDEVKSERDMVEIVESTDDIVGETCEGASEIVVSNSVFLDHEVGNLEEKKGSEFLILLSQNELPLEVNSSIITNEAQEESACAVQFTTCRDVEVLQEKEDMNINIDPLHVHDDTLDVAYPQSESLKCEEDITKEDNFHFNTSQLSDRSGVLSSDMHVIGSNTETEDILAEDFADASVVELATETYQRSHEIGASMKTEMNENYFSDERGSDDINENSQPEGSLIVTSNESRKEVSVGSARTININNTSDHVKTTTEINDVSVDGRDVGANVENGTEIILKDFQPCDLLQSEVEQSNDLRKNNSDDASEMGKIERGITDAQCKEMPKSANSDFESPVISDVVIDGPARKSNGTNIDPVSAIIEDEINSNIKLYEECKTFAGTAADSHETREVQLLVKATEDLPGKHTSHSSTNTETSALHDSAFEDNSGREPDGKVSSITDVPLPFEDQSINNLVKPSSLRNDASVESGSQRDSLDGNWGSGSVFSTLSDAPAVIDAKTLPSTGLLASTEAGNSNSNLPQAAPADRQLSGKSETFELPSFTTLVESIRVATSPKGAAASEVHSSQQSNSTSQAGWFPTLNQVINVPEGKKKNEEITAKVRNWSSSKEHTPLKSLLGEAINSNNAKSLKMEENNGSGLTTVNSILGPESPSSQVLKGEAANEWNSPARYPANIKREKRKLKSRPFWIQLVCCTTVDPQRR